MDTYIDLCDYLHIVLDLHRVKIFMKINIICRDCLLLILDVRLSLFF